MKVKGEAGLVQKHLYSRTSYLYQAATYLASVQSGPPISVAALAESRVDQEQPRQQQIEPAPEDEVKEPKISDSENLCAPHSEQQALSRLLIRNLKAISLKAQIRLTLEMKHTMCKRCDSILVAGQSATHQLENQSRGGKKPWADVLKVTCNSCGAVKRFPVGAKRQRKRAERKRRDENVMSAP